MATLVFVHRVDAQSIDDRRQQLKQLIADEWEYELKESPEQATAIGDYRYNDHWSDSSLEHVSEQKQDALSWIKRFEAFDDTGFPEQEKLNRALMLRILKQRVEGIDLKTYEMPIDQFNGAHLELAEFVAAIPFDSTKHYEDYLNRLHLIPQVLDQIIGILKQGEKDGLMPPRFLLEKTVSQCTSIAQPAGEASAFGQPVAHFPDSVPATGSVCMTPFWLRSITKSALPTSDSRIFWPRTTPPKAAPILECGLYPAAMRCIASTSGS